MSNDSSNGSGNRSVPQPSSVPLSCADVAPYLSAFADGELASPIREQVAAHLAACDTCSAQLARYAEIDMVLATLPRSQPSSEVYERIAAAVGGRTGEPAVRESLSQRRPIHLRRRVELPEWAEEPVATVPRSGGHSRLPRWAAAALPTVAAIVLVTLTAVAIRGLGMRAPQTVTTTHISSPAVTGDPLEQTRAAVQAKTAGKALKFTPVLPSYVPGAPTFQGVSAQVVADSSGNGVLYLDVTWKLSGAVTQVHLLEGPNSNPWYGYTPANATGLTWQAKPGYQWTPLSMNDGSGRLAVGEQRATSWLAMDATLAPSTLRTPTPTPDSTQVANVPGITMLRRMSLSMDLPYLPTLAQILPAPPNPMFHYKGMLADSNGRIEVYSYAGQTSVEVQADGEDYIDISNGQQGIRLDRNRHTYQQLPPGELTPSALNPLGAHIFVGANDYLITGGLWNVGTTTYNGVSVYDFVLVVAQNPTQVYVDQHSNMVVAVTVDPTSNEHPGGPGATSFFTGADGCAKYTLVESLPSTTSISFSTTPPPNYNPGSVPSRVACASGASQVIRQ